MSCCIGSHSIFYFTSHSPLASLGLHRFQCFNITSAHNWLCDWRLPGPHFGNHVYQVTWLSASRLIPESCCATPLWCRRMHRDAYSLLCFCCCSVFGSSWEEIQSLWSSEWPWHTPQEAYWVVGHACVGGITQIWSVRKHDRHQAGDKKRKKSILGAAWLPNILLLQWECRPQGCSEEHLSYAHPAVLYTQVSRPRDFGTCCWRLYPVEHYMSFLFWNLLMD